MILLIEKLAQKYNVALNQEIMEVANENGPDNGTNEINVNASISY